MVRVNGFWGCSGDMLDGSNLLVSYLLLFSCIWTKALCMSTLPSWNNSYCPNSECHWFPKMLKSSCDKYWQVYNKLKLRYNNLNLFGESYQQQNPMRSSSTSSKFYTIKYSVKSKTAEPWGVWANIISYKMVGMVPGHVLNDLYWHPLEAAYIPASSVLIICFRLTYSQWPYLYSVWLCLD